MKGYTPVEIPVKNYVKAYIISQMGDNPIMNTESEIGSKLHDLLFRKANEDKLRFAHNYEAKIVVYLTFRTVVRRGTRLNETNLKYFNRFVEAHIKKHMRIMMDFYIDILPSFESNLPEVRRHLGISIEDWSDEAMKKDYYRYRIKAHKPMLYKKHPGSDKKASNGVVDHPILSVYAN